VAVLAGPVPQCLILVCVSRGAGVQHVRELFVSGRGVLILESRESVVRWGEDDLAPP
jgi:hypothetical protein